MRAEWPCTIKCGIISVLTEAVSPGSPGTAQQRLPVQSVARGVGSQCTGLGVANRGYGWAALSKPRSLFWYNPGMLTIKIPVSGGAVYPISPDVEAASGAMYRAVIAFCAAVGKVEAITIHGDVKSADGADSLTVVLRRSVDPPPLNCPNVKDS